MKALYRSSTTQHAALNKLRVFVCLCEYNIFFSPVRTYRQTSRMLHVYTWNCIALYRFGSTSLRYVDKKMIKAGRGYKI